MYRFIEPIDNKDIIFSNQVYLFYKFFLLPEFNRKYISPFREDNNPGCYFWVSEKNILYFVDWGDIKTHHNIIDFIMRIYSCSYENAINIALEAIYNKDEQLVLPEIKKAQKKEKRVKIDVTIREFTQKDNIYWSQYKLYYQEFNRIGNYKIYPVKEYKLKDKTVIPNFYTYVYVFDDGIKIYSPYSEYKWISNVSKDNLGKNYFSYDELIITKSIKDGLVLNKFKKSNLITQSESSLPKLSILANEIKKFKKVKILFDNDKTGREYAKRLNSIIKYNITQKTKIIFTPKQKDISDLTKCYGLRSSFETAIS